MSTDAVTRGQGQQEASSHSQTSSASTALGRDWEPTSTNRGGSTSTVQTTAETTTAIFQTAPYCGFSDGRIPDELILMVLANVDHPDLYQLRLASRDFSRLLRDGDSWKSVAVRTGCPIDPESSLSPERQVINFIYRLIANVFDLDDLPKDIQPILEKPVLAINEINFLQTVLTDIEFLVFYDNLVKRATWRGAGLTRPRLTFTTSQELFAEAKRCREEFRANLATFVREDHLMLGGLNLTSIKFTSIPKEATELIGLKYVEFADNKLTSFPKVLADLPLLHYLGLGRNKLASFPNVLKGFNQLDELDLGGNNLVVLPQFICKQVQLSHLWLYENRLTTIPKEISNLRNLKVLMIRDNPMQRVPPEVDSLPKLLLWGDLRSIPRLTEAQAIERGFLQEEFFDAPEVEDVFYEVEED